jgi:hypothetical protein
MSILEALALAIAGTSLLLVAFSMTKNYFKNEDFRSAFLHYLDSSAKLTEFSKSYSRVIEIVLLDTMPFGSYNKKLILIMNSALITAVSSLYRELDGDSAEKHRSNTIVGIMLLEKLKRTTKLQFTLVLCLILNLMLSFLPEIRFSYFLFALVSLLLFCIHVDQQLIEYRIRKGWYGKNEYEAKEIIDFIISHSNKDDFNSSGGLKRVVPLPEIDPEAEKANGFNGATV